MEVDRSLGKTLYRQIYEKLKEAISDGKYKSGELLPSERELCDQFGVERMTVRRSLDLLVEEGLVEKKPGLGTVVKEFPISFLGKSNFKNIIFILPKSINTVDRITESFNSSLFYKIEKECRDRGYSLIYATLGENDELEKVFNGNSISGVMFVSKINEKFLEEIRLSGISSVFINNYVEGFNSIVADNEKGAYEAVMHLNQLGHRQIGIILGTPGYNTSIERFNGFKRALSDLNIDLQDQMIAQGNWTFDGGFKAMKELLLQNKSNLTAIFASNDMTAIGAIEAAKEEGLSIPNDISVIGFDNIEQCTYLQPNLTTVAVDIDLMAKAGCQQLFNSIETGLSLNLKLVIPARLIIRNSTARLK